MFNVFGLCFSLRISVSRAFLFRANSDVSFSEIKRRLLYLSSTVFSSLNSLSISFLRDTLSRSALSLSDSHCLIWLSLYSYWLFKEVNSLKTEFFSSCTRCLLRISVSRESLSRASSSSNL
ncbi:hypothetical protein AMECASPLE_036146 [Ameca splendens]|uniref:Secreted protein n=1 Tax=Ameca splendens TaxID=208324 RepID=A0ABV0Y7X0_9TELE